MANPFSDPFGGDTDRTPTASIAPPASIASRPLPPAHGAVARYATPVYPSARADQASIAGWTAEGGTPIVMAQGESAEIIARRYGIPTAALLRTNGFTSSAQVRPGTRLIIPTYSAALAASSGVHWASRAPSRERLQFVKGPQPAEHRLAKLEHSRRQLAAEKARAEKSARLIKPVHHEASIAKPILAEVQQKRASVDATTTSIVAAADKDAAPEFRWPAHGRIIQCYKCDGNDGINIALPEGTSVKAAEAGVVAYAGNALKGYGNLILIRHPDGFVTAYADNAEIEVKRGEIVKRGQVIAKSGQSGNVASPQLHFELRKGSTPVDPTQYLAGL
ncbi:MAG: peptidoglycan DD-metalloendopeptidase family protein [Methylovirgula sp.]